MRAFSIKNSRRKVQTLKASSIRLIFEWNQPQSGKAVVQMFIYECMNSSIAFNAITSASEVRHAFKCFVRADPDHALEARSIGCTETKHIGILYFKKMPEIHSFQDPGTWLML